MLFNVVISLFFAKRCKICGDNWEYHSSNQNDPDPFKICRNCRALGPDKPAKYIIPKGSDLPPSVDDRTSPIVSDAEIPAIYQEYIDDLQQFAKRKDICGRK